MSRRVGEGFAAAEVMKLTGVGYRRLDDWATTGFITPSLCPARGQGNERRYSFADLLAIRTALRLRESGVSVQALRKVVARLRERRPAPGAYLVSDGAEVYEQTREELGALLGTAGPAVLFLVDVGQVCRELEEAVREAG